MDAVSGKSRERAGLETVLVSYFGDKLNTKSYR